MRGERREVILLYYVPPARASRHLYPPHSSCLLLFSGGRSRGSALPAASWARGLGPALCALRRSRACGGRRRLGRVDDPVAARAFRCRFGTVHCGCCTMYIVAVPCVNISRRDAPPSLDTYVVCVCGDPGRVIPDSAAVWPGDALRCVRPRSARILDIGRANGVRSVEDRGELVQADSRFTDVACF